MMVCRAAWCVLGSLLLLQGVRGNPDGPFGDGNTDDVIDMTPSQYEQLVKREDRKFGLVVLVVDAEVGGRNCPHCAYADKQFSDFVASYKRQFRLGWTYNEDRYPTYFVRVKLTDQAARMMAGDLRIRTMPGLGFLRVGAAKAVEYGRNTISDPLTSRLRKDLNEEAEARRKMGQKMSSQALLKAAKRRERRNKQVTTQEEQEYEGYGMRDHNAFLAVNLCKFFRSKGGLHLAECPQDAPLDFQQKKKPQDFLKNVLMLGIAGSAIVCLMRIFGIGIPLVDPNMWDLREQVHLKSCIAAGDQHQMVTRRPAWEVLGTYALYAVVLVAYALLTGGMYWNILNRVPWYGPTSVAPQSRQQYGSESALLAMLSTTGAVGMVAAGHALCPRFLEFTRAKGPFQMTEDLRKQAKLWVSAGGVVLWFFMYILILRMFLLKNRSYLWNTRMNYFLSFLRPQ